MPKKSADDIADTFERLLAAADQLAIDHGFSGFTTRDLCDEAGLSVGALYDHFENKRDVARSCIRWNVGSVHEFIRLGVPYYDPPLERLEQLMRRHLDILGGQWGYDECARAVATWGEYVRDPEIAEPYVAELATLLVEMGRILRDGQGDGQIERRLYAPAAAEALTALLLGLMLLRRLGWCFTPLRMGNAISVLLRGLEPRPA